MKAWLPLVAVLASSPAFADVDPPATPAPPVASPPIASPPIEPSPSPPVAEPPPPAAPPPVWAPPPQQESELTGKDIRITTEGERSRKNIELVAGLAAGAAILLGVGAYYNLDSQSAANAVSASVALNLNDVVMSSGRLWTAADQSNYDRAHDSAVKAGVFYGVGGALLIGAVVTLVMTDPKSETTIIHPHNTPTVAPTPGGAILGSAWSF